MCYAHPSQPFLAHRLRQPGGAQAGGGAARAGADDADRARAARAPQAGGAGRAATAAAGQAPRYPQRHRGAHLLPGAGGRRLHPQADREHLALGHCVV